MTPSIKDEPKEEKLCKDAERKVCAKNYPPRRIPRNVLKRTLQIATHPSDGFWLNKNTSCAAPASFERTYFMRRSLTYEKLRLARNCAMQRDFKNLAKLLASKLYGDKAVQKTGYNVFSDYASILQKLTKNKTKESQKPSPDDEENSQTVDVNDSLNFILSL
ncbi:hypothetical protein KR009_003426 [Drosophila setifemur]|nr:hypothetical protein KR009_003426 [Drosophila setifemur]